MLAKNITFRQLQVSLAERAGLAGMPSQKTLPNANSAMEDFLERIGISWETEVGSILRASFGGALEAHEKELRASGASPGHVRNRGWLLRFWFHLVTVLDHESAIAARAPTPLMLALRALFADGSRKRTPTARAAKVQPDALKAWMNGKLPARDQEVSALSRLEDVCHKAPGCLTSLLPTRMPSRRVMKATRAPSTNKYRARAARLSLETYRLPRNAMYANETLRHQWLELLRDKIHGSARGSASTVLWTAEMVDQLYDAPVEALDDPWRLRPLRVREPARWFDCVDGYVISSAAQKFNQVRMLLGWASKPVAEGGAGLAYDRLTLALCADHKLVMSPDNQPGKRDNQDGKFFEGAFFEPFGSDLTRLEAI